MASRVSETGGEKAPCHRLPWELCNRHVYHFGWERNKEGGMLQDSNPPLPSCAVAESSHLYNSLPMLNSYAAHHLSKIPITDWVGATSLKPGAISDTRCVRWVIAPQQGLVVQDFWHSSAVILNPEAHICGTWHARQVLVRVHWAGHMYIC